jgi:hypothetical protein
MYQRRPTPRICDSFNPAFVPMALAPHSYSRRWAPLIPAHPLRKPGVKQSGWSDSYDMRFNPVLTHRQQILHGSDFVLQIPLKMKSGVYVVLVESSSSTVVRQKNQSCKGDDVHLLRLSDLQNPSCNTKLLRPSHLCLPDLPLSRNISSQLLCRLYSLIHSGSSWPARRWPTRGLLLRLPLFFIPAAKAWRSISALFEAAADRYVMALAGSGVQPQPRRREWPYRTCDRTFPRSASVAYIEVACSRDPDSCRRICFFDVDVDLSNTDASRTRSGPWSRVVV